MNSTERAQNNPTTQAIEIAIRLGLLFLILGWCLQILGHFISIVAWGAIIAVAIYPLFLKLESKLGGRKKLAVTVGLKAARHEKILLTDADCRAEGPRWLQLMVSGLSGEKEIILGYGKYERKKGLLNAIIRYETAFTAMQYFALALKGKAYMGVGRNLAYNKELFFSKKGFSSHYHIPSGDDDLFVNENASASNTAIEIRPGSHTISVPESNFGSWFRQKKRHLSAGSHYSKASRLRIGREIMSRFLLYTSFILLMSTGCCLLSAAALFLIFEITRTSIFRRSLKHLKEKYLLLPSLLLDPLIPLLLALIRISNIFTTKKQAWK